MGWTSPSWTKGGHPCLHPFHAGLGQNLIQLWLKSQTLQYKHTDYQQIQIYRNVIRAYLSNGWCVVIKHWKAYNQGHSQKFYNGMMCPDWGRGILRVGLNTNLHDIMFLPHLYMALVGSLLGSHLNNFFCLPRYKKAMVILHSTTS